MKRGKLFTVPILILAICHVLPSPARASEALFTDAPPEHWAYDALSSLAARGLVSGYPGELFEGASPAWRYEIASAVARVAAETDVEKADKRDLDMIRDLIAEFAGELNALGKLDKLDKNAGKIDARLGAAEEDLGGWIMSGVFQFDAKFGADEELGFYEQPWFIGRNQFYLTYYTIFLRRRIDKNTAFEASLSKPNLQIDEPKNIVFDFYNISIKLPWWDATLDIGRKWFDWERELGFAVGVKGDSDSVLGGTYYKGFYFRKDWGSAGLHLIYSAESDITTGSIEGNTLRRTTIITPIEQYFLALRADFSISERLRAGLLGYYFWPDVEVENVNGTGHTSESDHLTAGAYAGYTLMPGVELKGLFYHQKQGDFYVTDDGSTKASLWRAAADIGQDVLKYTSLHLEYGGWDNNLIRWGWQFTYNGPNVMFNQPINSRSARVWSVLAEQKWNDRWSTFARYFHADFDTPGIDDTATWGGGIGYQHNPALRFELTYDELDYGSGNPSGYRNGSDGVFVFRTFAAF
ncbi:MAG: S-layer homology domain-containing protein [Synergistaceae bacterium]|nr:S-layer homology domain-containing protein [Synergistaceae bacterium]